MRVHERLGRTIQSRPQFHQFHLQFHEFTATFTFQNQRPCSVFFLRTAPSSVFDAWRRAKEVVEPPDGVEGPPVLRDRMPNDEAGRLPRKEGPLNHGGLVSPQILKGNVFASGRWNSDLNASILTVLQV